FVAVIIIRLPSMCAAPSRAALRARQRHPSVLPAHRQSIPALNNVTGTAVYICYVPAQRMVGAGKKIRAVFHAAPAIHNLHRLVWLEKSVPPAAWQFPAAQALQHHPAVPQGIPVLSPPTDSCAPVAINS